MARINEPQFPGFGLLMIIVGIGGLIAGKIGIGLLLILSGAGLFFSPMWRK